MCMYMQAIITISKNKTKKNPYEFKEECEQAPERILREDT